MNRFHLRAPFTPAGDQPKAIQQLTAGIKRGLSRQTLLGTTGSGKTMTMASIINETQKPALVISHNKTLAAQLAEEFKEFFPDNAVSYFVSYYDYYQPEAYIPRTDTYIAKDASINKEIDRLRHAAMETVLTRRDVIVVASVSCIYGIGAPIDYLDARLELKAGQRIARNDMLRHLTSLQYTRNDTDLTRGSFRVRGDIVDIFPAGEDHIIRVEFFGKVIDRLERLDALTGTPLTPRGQGQDSDTKADIFPATFFIINEDQRQQSLASIRQELAERLQHLKQQNLLLEAQRLEQRTSYDLEMIEQLGYVSGIENYSRHMDGRAPGEPPSTLID
ncbi:MAG: DEAD/DEAH box helicase family protein, partial [Acidobacteriota bacterium]